MHYNNYDDEELVHYPVELKISTKMSDKMSVWDAGEH